MIEKGVPYFGRVRHRAENGAISPWSNVVSFEAKDIETPSFQVVSAITASVTDLWLTLSPFAGNGASQEAVYVQTSKNASFTDIVNEQSVPTTEALVQFKLTAVTNQVHYLRFKYISTTGSESLWSNTKQVTYVAAAQGVTIQGFNLRVSAFSFNTSATGSFTILGSSNFTYEQVYGTVISTTVTPVVATTAENFTTPTTNSFTGTATLGSNTQDTYELEMFVGIRNTTTNELFYFTPKATALNPPKAVVTPTMTTSKTTIPAQGNPSYPSGLPPYQAAQGDVRYPQGLPAYWRTFNRTSGATNFALFSPGDGATLRGNYSSSSTTDAGVTITAGIQTDVNNRYSPGFQVNLGGTTAGPSWTNPPYRANGQGWTYNSGSNTSVTAATVLVLFKCDYIINNGLGYAVNIPWGTLTQSGLSGWPGGLPPYQTAQGNPSYPSGLPVYQAETKTFTLTASVFSANWAQTHTSTEWQISTVASFATIFQSATVSTGNLRVFTTNSMNGATTYYARVRYRSNDGIYSNWSVGYTLI